MNDEEWAALKLREERLDRWGVVVVIASLIGLLVFFSALARGWI